MKRLIALFCLVSLCLSLFACSPAQTTESATGTTTGDATNETSQKTEEEKDPIVYPDGFAVGYGRTDITPTGPLPIYNATGLSTHDPLQFTATAIYDGENIALLCSLDLKNMNLTFYDLFTKVIAREYNIPADHVLFNITHTHSAPSSTFSGLEGIKWRNLLMERIPAAVEQALRDLDLVEGVYVGKGYTDGITFVRRYLMPDGSYVTNPTTGTASAHESEADNEMRTIRIDRKNKKDVLMVNYQTHYGSATGLYKNQYSADFVHEFREAAEKEWDCHFVYYSGASGNINFNSAIRGERKYSDFIQAVKQGFIPTVKDCLKGEQKVEIGPLRFASNWYEASIHQDDPQTIANAKIINGLTEGTQAYTDALARYNLTTRQVQGIMTRVGVGAPTQKVPFYAVSFGDIGFAASPYEMFDTNGVQVRDGSPFKMTFVCSYTNGGYGYVPSAAAYPHGGYEVYVSRFTANSGDDFALEMVRLLTECKNQNTPAANYIPITQKAPC